MTYNKLHIEAAYSRSRLCQEQHICNCIAKMPRNMFKISRFGSKRLSVIPEENAYTIPRCDSASVGEKLAPELPLPKLPPSRVPAPNYFWLVAEKVKRKPSYLNKSATYENTSANHELYVNVGLQHGKGSAVSTALTATSNLVFTHWYIKHPFTNSVPSMMTECERCL